MAGARASVGMRPEHRRQRRVTGTGHLHSTTAGHRQPKKQQPGLGFNLIGHGNTGARHKGRTEHKRGSLPVVPQISSPATTTAQKHPHGTMAVHHIASEGKEITAGPHLGLESWRRRRWINSALESTVGKQQVWRSSRLRRSTRTATRRETGLLLLPLYG